LFFCVLLVITGVSMQKEVLDAVQLQSRQNLGTSGTNLHKTHNLQVMQLQQQQQRTSDPGNGEPSNSKMAGMMGSRNSNKIHVGSGSHRGGLRRQGWQRWRVSRWDSLRATIPRAAAVAAAVATFQKLV